LANKGLPNQTWLEKTADLSRNRVYSTGGVGGGGSSRDNLLLGGVVVE
jgi:hypothetical protein